MRAGGRDVRGTGRVTTPSERFTLVFGYTVLVTWALSFVLEWKVEGYDPPPALNPIMMLIAGAIFAGKTASAIRKAANGNGDGAATEEKS